MGDLGTDYDSGIELIMRAHEELRAKNPNHELLRFVTTRPEGIFYSREHYDEMLRRFAPDENTPALKMMINYFLALEEAIDPARVPAPKTF